jgi:DUF1016 N-terminal domain
LDYDQRNTLHFGGQYTLPWRSYASTDVYYASGFMNGDPTVPGDHLQPHTKKRTNLAELSYSQFFTDLAELLEQAREYSARSVNAVMTHTYWEVGRRIVEHEQHGKKRAVYGEALIERLPLDLTGKFGRGFSQSNPWQMRDFYLAWPILQTVSGESRPPKPISVDTPKFQTLSGLSSEHLRLLTVTGKEARAFYETEALRGGWSVRQLDRQIATQFYERTALTRNQAAWRRAESPANHSPCLNREEIWEITTAFDAQEPLQASCQTAWMSVRMISNPNGSGN